MTDTTRPQNTPDFSAVIAQLYVYPVKSCAGVAVKEAYLTETGLDLDRAWMVVDAQGKVSPRPVKIGSAKGSQWVILDGLQAGEQVMVDGFQKLQGGAPVKPVPWQAPAANGAGNGTGAANAASPAKGPASASSAAPAASAAAR